MDEKQFHDCMKLQERKISKGRSQKGELQKIPTIRKEDGKAIVMKEGAFTPNHNWVNYRTKKSRVREIIILEDSCISF